MVNRSSHIRLAGTVAALAFAGATLAACAQPHQPAQQVNADNPSVTYKYMGDQELIAANQKAETYCAAYSAVPRAAVLSSDPDGSKIAKFECVAPPAKVAVVTPPPSNLTYTYTTDQELVDASRNAQTYCSASRSQPVIASMTTNINGSKTVMFQCSPR